MRVDEKIPRDEYFADSRFAAKKATTNGSYEKTRGDNQCPRNDFERHEQFVTVQAGCGRQLKKVFKILQLDLDIA
jgi:hypothetical protein